MIYRFKRLKFDFIFYFFYYLKTTKGFKMEKEALVLKRKKFFEEIFHVINIEPIQMDKFLNQAKYYIKPSFEQSFINEEFGDLVLTVNGQFFNKSFSINYTLWQLGTNLKIGLTIKEIDLQGALISDENQEISTLWDNDSKPDIDIARGCVFYNWSFFVPDLYTNYQTQEPFIYGIRHMHFRVLKLLYDECAREAKK